MDLLVQDSAIDDDEDDDIIEGGDVENTTAIGAVKTTAVSSSDGTGSGTNTDDDDKDDYGVPIVQRSSKNSTVGRMRGEHNQATSMTTRQRLINAWDKEAVAEQMDAHVQMDNTKRMSSLLFDAGGGSSMMIANSSSSNSSNNNKNKPSKYATSWGLQYR